MAGVGREGLAQGEQSLAPAALPGQCLGLDVELVRLRQAGSAPLLRGVECIACAGMGGVERRGMPCRGYRVGETPLVGPTEGARVMGLGALALRPRQGLGGLGKGGVGVTAVHEGGDGHVPLPLVRRPHACVVGFLAAGAPQLAGKDGIGGQLGRHAERAAVARLGRGRMALEHQGVATADEAARPAAGGGERE